MSLEVGPHLLVSLLSGFDYSIHSFNSEIIQQLLIIHISKIHDNQAIQRIPKARVHCKTDEGTS